MFDPEAKYAALEVTVANLNQQVRTLEHSTSAGFTALSGKIDILARDMASAGRPPWATLITAGMFALAVASAIGGLAYLPIKDGLGDVKAALVEIRKSTVSRDEMDWRAARGIEDRDRTDKVIAALRDAQVPRAEYNVRLAGIDHDHDDLQRQIDQIRTSLGDTYSLKDFIRDLQGRIDRLETARRLP